jgi:APA family basic amino acid/polyamine antiporter
MPWMACSGQGPPLLSIACCFLLMVGLPLETWMRLFAWLAIGLVIYALFGKKRAAAAE